MTGVPAAALPGITVLGSGETTATPDGALVGLSVGSGSDFGPGGPVVAFVGQGEIDPVVTALKHAGAENVSADRFSSSPYGGPGGAAQISFQAPRAGDVEKLINAAQDAVRKRTDYNVQSASVVFTVSNCQQLEAKAWKDALADARRRADQLAALSDVGLGRILAVSEAATQGSPFAPGSTGCQALRLQNLNLGQFRTVENSPQTVTVAVSIQVTYALAKR